MDLFSNREIAMAIWIMVGIGVLFVLALSTAMVRKVLLDIIDIIKGFCQRQILIWVGLMLLYTAGMVGILYTANLWNVSLLKDTILWFCLTGIVLAFRYVTKEDNENIFSSIVADSFKVVVLFEFLVNTYTFSLWIELVLIPLVSLIVLLDAVARTDERFTAVVRLTTGLLVVIGFFVLFHAVGRAISEFDSLWTINTAHSILLAPILSLLFAPFIYLMLVYLEYKKLFVQLRTGPEKQRDLQRYAKRRLVGHLGLKLANVRAFNRMHPHGLRRIKTRDDLDILLRGASSG